MSSPAFERFGFYTVDVDYMEFLYNRDSEVYYNPDYRDANKPFIGIIVHLSDYEYFIPMTSAKERHRRLKNVSDEHLLVYERVPIDLNVFNAIYKPFSDEEKLHILAALDIKKMIPVPEACRTAIIFQNLEDERYRHLLEKEYAFCLSRKDKILEKAKKCYDAQCSFHTVRARHCNYLLCEAALKEWEGTNCPENLSSQI